MMDKKNVNSVDIANMTGVSRSTVSKVLNNYPGISEATRKKVLDAVEKSGYYPNFSAQALTGKNKRVLGFFSFDTGLESPQAAYITGLIALGVYNVASRLGYQVLSVLLHPDGSNLGQITDAFRQGRIDAGIFEAHTLMDDIVEELSRQYVVGLLDAPRAAAEVQNRIQIGLDNYHCGRTAIDYLYGLGHRRIALIAGNQAWYSADERFHGFMDGLAMHRLQPVNPGGAKGFYGPEGHRRMEEILHAAEGLPTAVACSNDDLAIGAIEAIHSHGLRVPEDISVIGIENNPVGSYVDPPLTTLRLDMEASITELVTSVVGGIEAANGPVTRYRVYPAQLIERKSCAPPKD